MTDYYKFKIRDNNKLIVDSGQLVARRVKCYQLLTTNYKLVFFLLLFTFYLSPFTSNAQWLSGIKDSWAEKWRTHAEADPFTISGTIGASLNSSWNNRDVLGATSPFSTAAYADFILNVYGFSFPIHIDLFNVSQTQFTFPHPVININTTPTIGEFRFHLGTSSMHFNNYTYSGLPFTGVGVEWDHKALHIAAFYGTLSRATKFGPDDRSPIQHYADSLLGLNLRESTVIQFSRYAVGAKIGIGNNANYFDINFIKAKDDSTSLPRIWYGELGDTNIRDSILRAKENLSIGFTGRLALGKHFALQANLGISLYTDDLSTPILADYIDSQSVEGGMLSGEAAKLKPYAKLMRQFDWVFSVHTESMIHLAGDAALSYNFSRLNGMITYRFAQPDYTSLGASLFSQNSQGIGATANLQLFNRRRGFLSLSGFAQRDNLYRKQVATNQVVTANASYSQSLSDHINVLFSYNGIKQDQLDGTEHVNDTTRTNQIVHNFNASPSYMFSSEKMEHTITLNLNITSNKNLNSLSPNKIDLTTYTAGLGYDVAILKTGLGLGITYDFSDSRAVDNSYRSHGLGISANYNILKKKDVKLRASYSGILAFNSNTDKGDEMEADTLTHYTTRNISISNRIGINMNIKNQHALDFNLSLSNYSENIVLGQRISTNMDLRLALNYTYSFAARIIKSRVKHKEKEEE